MSFNISATPSTTATVTISGTQTVSLPSPSSSQTIITKHLTNISIVAGTPQTLYTVTAGKTFYCLGFSGLNQNSATIGKVLVDGTQVLNFMIGGSIGAGGGNSQHVLTGGVLFTAPATKTVQVDSVLNTGAGTSVCCWGYEQ